MLINGVNHCTNSEYHADKKYLSSSNLKTLLKNPQQFYEEKVLGIKEASVGNHFDEGSLTHSYILEPQQVPKEYAFYPGMRKSGEDFILFKEANKGKMVISRPQAVRVAQYVEAYKRNPKAVSMIKKGLPEHTLCTELMGVPVKARLDWANIDDGIIVDVKTTGMPADVDSFRLTISNFSYDLSAALYAMVAREVYGKQFSFYFLVIDKKSLLCHVYKASDATIAKGEAQVIKALKLYKQCVESGNWKLDQPPTEVPDGILEV